MESYVLNNVGPELPRECQGCPMGCSGSTNQTDNSWAVRVHVLNPRTQEAEGGKSLEFKASQVFTKLIPRAARTTQINSALHQDGLR